MSEKTILFFAKIGGMDGQKYHPREGRQGVGGAPPLRRWGRSPPLITPFLTPTSKERIKGSKKYMSWHFFFITVNDFFWGGATLFESPPAKYKADARGRDVHTFSNSFLFHFAFFPLFLLFLSFLFFFCFFGALGGAPGGTPPLLPPLVTAQGKRRKTSINCSFCPINHI